MLLKNNLSCLSQITIQRDSGLDVSSPKHGKIDTKNAPHVGGNQWAGGTGKLHPLCFMTQ